MSSHNSPRTSVEQRGLLRSSSFEVNDSDSIERFEKPTNRLKEGWWNSRRRWGPWLRPRNLFIGFAILFGLTILGTFWSQRSEPRGSKANTANPSESPKPSAPIEVHKPAATSNPQEPTSPGKTDPKPVKIDNNGKPKDLQIIGLVFFGRPPVVAILDCYLKKNLASNGGYLDEVHWVVNTDNQEDIAYLDKLVNTSEKYKKIDLPSLGYNSVWEHAVESGPMYIKIDDDIVYVSDNAIADLVYTKLNHPHALDVVANIVNSPETGWLHYHVGAVHAYLPEFKPKDDNNATNYGPKAWRASHLPLWYEHHTMEFHLGDKPDDGSVLKEGTRGAPPFKGHRWLPLPDPDINLYRTPAAQSKYDPYGPDWRNWALAAQAHYSLLENIENDRLDLYYYGKGLDPAREGIWDMNYERMNINFMAIMGKDVLDHSPFGEGDDENFLSITLPVRLRRPLLVNTHAVVAHFSFRTQHEVYDTDLLSRYRAYANEMICTPDNQIPTS